MIDPVKDYGLNFEHVYENIVVNTRHAINDTEKVNLI
jgi:hypothetical protein